MAPIRLLCEIHPSTIGGTERFLERLLPRLSRNGFDVVAVSPRRGAPLRLLERAGIETRVVRGYDSIHGEARLEALLRRERIDIAQSCYYLSTLAMAAAHAGVPHVWRLGGHVRVGSGVEDAAEGRSLTSLIPLLSSRIVCNSRFVASQFPRAARRRVLVVPNGIVVPRLGNDRRRPSTFRIGMVAHLTPQKRHDDFLDAAERVVALRDDVQFEMFGAAYNHRRGRADANAILRRARVMLDSGQLALTAFDDVSNIYRRLDLLVQPSVGESCSNAVLEAMASGVPVVAARSGGHPELIHHERSGLLVPAKDPRALARAIVRVLDDRALADRLGREARRQAARRFSIDECVAQYAKIYRAAVEPAGLPA